MLFVRLHLKISLSLRPKKKNPSCVPLQRPRAVEANKALWNLVLGWHASEDVFTEQKLGCSAAVCAILRDIVTLRRIRSAFQIRSWSISNFNLFVRRYCPRRTVPRRTGRQKLFATLSDSNVSTHDPGPGGPNCRLNHDFALRLIRAAHAFTEQVILALTNHCGVNALTHHCGCRCVHPDDCAPVCRRPCEHRLGESATFLAN